MIYGFLYKNYFNYAGTTIKVNIEKSKLIFELANVKSKKINNYYFWHTIIILKVVQQNFMNSSLIKKYYYY